MKIIQKLKAFYLANSKIIILAAIVFSFAVKLNSYFAYINYGPDNIVQAITANSFMSGHGLSLPEADTCNLSNTVYEPYGLFPPGFALTIIPLLKITDNNLNGSIRILLIITLALFYFIWVKIMYIIKDYVRIEVVPALMLFWAFNYSPLRLGGATDLISLLLISISVFFLLKIIILKSNIYFYSFLIGVFSFLASFYRFAYYPITFAVPTFYLGFALCVNKKLRKPAILTIMITAMLMLVLLTFQNNTYGAVNWVETNVVAKSIHWENLTFFDAVFLNSFISDSLFYRTFAQETLNSQSSFALFGLLITLSSLFFVMVSVLIFSLFRKEKIFREKLKLILGKTSSVFVLLLLWIIFVNIGFLTIISLRYPSFSLDPNFLLIWVFMPRYFMISFLCIQVIVFFILLKKENSLNTILKKIIFTILILVSIINFSFWYYHEKKLTSYKPEDEWLDYFTFQSFIKEHEKPLVIIQTQTEEYLYRLGMLQGASVINFEKINKRDLITDKNVNFLIPVPDHNAEPEYNEMINNHNAKKVLYLQALKMEVYSFELQKNSNGK